MFISIYLKLINLTSKWHRSDNFNYFTCTLATLGGSTSPLLSPWIIHITPMVRVVSPQEFWYTYCFSSVSWSWIQISNILEKFCPKWWDVAPWKKKPDNKLYMYSTKIKHACIYSKQQLLNWKLHVLLFLAAGSFIFLAIDILEMDFRQRSVMTLTSNCI